MQQNQSKGPIVECVPQNEIKSYLRLSQQLDFSHLSSCVKVDARLHAYNDMTTSRIDKEIMNPVIRLLSNFNFCIEHNEISKA